MRTDLITIERDIMTRYVMPENSSVPPDICVTDGDIHGNALRLLDMAYVHGILNVSQKDYEAFARIYVAQEATPTDSFDAIQRELHWNEFQQILNRINVNPSAKLRLIGDLLADRGANDVYTLCLLEKLMKNIVGLEILASNHDLAFIAWMEAKKAYPNKRSFADVVMLSQEQAASLYRLITLLDGKCAEITFERVSGIYEEYKQHLKLLSYDEDDAGNLLLYSHAHLDERDLPGMLQGMIDHATELSLDIDKEIMTQMSALFNRLSSDQVEIPIDDTKHLVDAINLIFVQAVMNNKISDMKNGEPKTKPMGYNLMPDMSPLLYATWNRSDIDKQDRQRKKNANIINVHGHHSYENGQLYAIGLDGNYGKSLLLEHRSHCQKGTLSVVYSRACRPTLTPAWDLYCDAKPKETASARPSHRP